MCGSRMRRIRAVRVVGSALVNGARILPGSGGVRCCRSAVMIYDSTWSPVGSAWCGEVGERVAADGGPPPSWARLGQVGGAAAGDGRLGAGAGAGPVRGGPFAAAGAEVGE